MKCWVKLHGVIDICVHQAECLSVKSIRNQVYKSIYCSPGLAVQRKVTKNSFQTVKTPLKRGFMWSWYLREIFGIWRSSVNRCHCLERSYGSVLLVSAKSFFCVPSVRRICSLSWSTDSTVTYSELRWSTLKVSIKCVSIYSISKAF